MFECRLIWVLIMPPAHQGLVKPWASRRLSHLQGLLHLTQLTRLEMQTWGDSWTPGCLLMSVVGQLTTLRCLRLPTLADWPSPSALSTLGYSALKQHSFSFSGILTAVAYIPMSSCCSDEAHVLSIKGQLFSLLPPVSACTHLHWSICELHSEKALRQVRRVCSYIAY